VRSFGEFDLAADYGVHIDVNYVVATGIAAGQCQLRARVLSRNGIVAPF
jgi:hypothetical protein